MAALFTINRIYAKHKNDYPESLLSERAIRRAVKSGDLPVIYSGNRALVSYDTFTNWLYGSVHLNHRERR